jgi:hypothetical protein
MKQPEALRLANEYYDDHWIVGTRLWCQETVEELRRLHEVNVELVEALSVVIRGVPDTWDGVKQAKAALAKAQGENND